MVAYILFFSTMSEKNNQDYQIKVSDQIKNSFLSRIRPVLKSVNPDYDGLDSQSFNSSYYIKRR